MSPVDVLVLEPDKNARSQLRETLQQMDFAPVVFGSLSDALARAESAHLAAVIVDINALVGKITSPVASESKLRSSIEQLRATQRGWLPDEETWRPLPVIVMSRVESLAEHAAALGAGADLYLSGAAAMTAGILGRHLERLLRDRAPDRNAVDRRASSHINDIFALPTQDLRSASGRLDAGRIADALGVPLVRFAEALEAPYTTVHKTPDSAALQPRLAPFANVLAMLNQIYDGDRPRVLAWLHAEQPALGRRTPQVALLMPGGAPGVEQFVAGAWLGEAE